MIKNRIERWLLTKYFNGLVPEKILVEAGKELYLGGEKLDVAQIQNLANEATMIMRTELWQVIYETLVKEAVDLQVKKAVSLDDIRHGRMMIYNLSVIQRMLNTFKSKKLDLK